MRKLLARLFETSTVRDPFCRWRHSQGWPYNRNGQSYQRCFTCGRELLSKVQIEGRAPFQPHSEREMTAIEKHWTQQREEVAELERIGKL